MVWRSQKIVPTELSHVMSSPSPSPGPRRKSASTTGARSSKTSRTERMPCMVDGGRSACCNERLQQSAQCNLKWLGIKTLPAASNSPFACRNDGSILSDRGSEPNTSCTQQRPRETGSPSNSSKPGPNFVLKVLRTSMTPSKPFAAINSRARSAKSFSASTATTLTAVSTPNRASAFLASNIDNKPVPAPMSKATRAESEGQASIASLTAAS
mmetsp:Transcript_106946/g.287996  ORF Transcript_106946/g.287996 Transcript_106946/m.287996 type:complete len:212 (-) Transcript_106946:445-1080(-)